MFWPRWCPSRVTSTSRRDRREPWMPERCQWSNWWWRRATCARPSHGQRISEPQDKCQTSRWESFLFFLKKKKEIMTQNGHIHGKLIWLAKYRQHQQPHFSKEKKKLIIFMIVLLPVPGRNALNIKQIHARPCGSIGKAPLAKEVLSTRASGIRRSLWRHIRKK